MTDLLELYHMAEAMGIEVDGFELNKRESLSLMDEDGQCFIAIDPFKLTSSKDEKAKLAHELGHCLTGSFYNRYAACDIRQKHENRADKCAIRFLVSKAELDGAIKRGYTHVWELAEYFGLPEEYMKKIVCWHKYGSLEVDQYF